MTDTEKDLIRRKLKGARQRISQLEHEQKSTEIIKRCISLIPWQKISSFHTFLPSRKLHEINTWPLLKLCWEGYPTIETVVPKVLGEKFHSIIVSTETKWRNGIYDIPEPVKGIAAAEDRQFDVIIVPMLGFDSYGNRLGYGKGMYDQFLSGQPDAVTIGLCYESGRVDALPVRSHDIALDYVVTEKRVLNFTS